MSVADAAAAAAYAGPQRGTADQPVTTALAVTSQYACAMLTPSNSSAPPLALYQSHLSSGTRSFMFSPDRPAGSRKANNSDT